MVDMKRLFLTITPTLFSKKEFLRISTFMVYYWKIGYKRNRWKTKWLDSQLFPQELMSIFPRLPCRVLHKFILKSLRQSSIFLCDLDKNKVVKWEMLSYFSFLILQIDNIWVLPKDKSIKDKNIWFNNSDKANIIRLNYESTRI